MFPIAVHEGGLGVFPAAVLQGGLGVFSAVVQQGGEETKPLALSYLLPVSQLLSLSRLTAKLYPIPWGVIALAQPVKSLYFSAAADMVSLAEWFFI